MLHRFSIALSFCPPRSLGVVRNPAHLTANVTATERAMLDSSVRAACVWRNLNRQIPFHRMRSRGRSGDAKGAWADKKMERLAMTVIHTLKTCASPEFASVRRPIHASRTMPVKSVYASPVKDVHSRTVRRSRCSTPCFELSTCQEGTRPRHK